MKDRAARILVDALSVTSGGGLSYAINLIRELDRDSRGFHFTILVPVGRLATIQTRRVEIRPIRLPARHRGLRIAARFAYEEWVLPIRALRHDAVYAIADLASPLIPVPTVVALRNLNIYDRAYDNSLRLRVLEKLVRLGTRRATRMVFPSRAAARLIGDRLGLPESMRRVIPHGVDTEPFSEGSIPEPGRPFLFLPAAIERHKNLTVLVDAIPHFSDPELEIRVAGSWSTDPTYRDELLARACNLGVEHRFHLLGPVPYEQIIAYYRMAVALVFPSFLETFGHPMLEAMLAGTPIIASKIPAFEEIGKDVALFFPPTDPSALAHAVDSVVTDPESAAERVKNGHERALDFSWRRSVDELCTVLKEVLRSTRSEP